MAFKMRNPFKQYKTSGFGPRENIECPDGMIYHEPSGKCLSPEAYEDAMGVGGNSNRSVMISDPKTTERLRKIEEEVSKLSKEELAELQRIADDKADRFHKRGKYAPK